MNTDVNIEIQDTLKLPAEVVKAGLYADCATSNLVVKTEDDKWITLGGEWVNPPDEVYEVVIEVKPGEALKKAVRKHQPFRTNQFHRV